MKFNIRKAIPSDIPSISRMIKNYYLELDKGNNKPFLITEDQLSRDVFSKNATIHFIVAAYNDTILAYAAYFFSYEIFHGASLVIEEVYVDKEYRNLGISIFLFSHIINVANINNSYLIKWILDISDKNVVEIESKAGVKINKDDLILYIYKHDVARFLAFKPNKNFEIREAKGIDLPDIFSLLENFATEVKAKLTLDIYKLMKDGFSNEPKFKFFIALTNNEVIGFISFFNAYSTFNGSALIVNKVFTDKKYRREGIGTMLMAKLFEYAKENNFNRIETSISKFEVEKIERLKEYNVFPYDYFRIATFNRTDYNKLLE